MSVAAAHAVVLTMHMPYYDRPVDTGVGADALVYGVAFLPTLAAVVAAVIIGVGWPRRGCQPPR